MVKDKQLDLVRKRNSDLMKKLEDMKSKLEVDQNLNKESYQQAKDLITELEEIKSEWLILIDSLQEKRDEYDELISTLKKIKTDMTNINNKMFSYMGK